MKIITPPAKKQQSIAIAKLWVPYGTSISGNADATNANATNALVAGYATWVNWLTGFRVPRPPGPTYNFGVAGDTTTQMLARLSSVLTAAPDIVVIEGGTNDIAASTPAATIIANLRTMYGALLASGAIVIRTSIIPRSSTGGTAFTTTQALNAFACNTADRRYAEANKGFYFVDLDPIVTDPTSASWAVLSNILNSFDGTHPNTNGASLIGAAVAAVINQIVPAWRNPFYSAADVYDATNNPAGNLLPNGMLTGSGGSFAGGSGTVATSLIANITANGGGATGVASQATLTDGRTAQIFTISGSKTGSSRFMTARQAATNSNFSAGDIVEGRAWINIGANTNIAAVNVYSTFTENAVTYQQNGASFDARNILPAAGWSGYLPITTPRHTITATPTDAELYVQIGFLDGSVSVAGAISIAGMQLRKVI